MQNKRKIVSNKIGKRIRTAGMKEYIGIICILLLAIFISPASAAINIVSNAGFESGTSPWAFYTDGSGSFLNDAAGNGSAHAGHIKISQQGTNVQLYQKNLVLEPNTLYKLDFKAYSNTGHDLSVSLFKHNSPYTNYGLSKSLDLGTKWGAYSIQFKTVGFPAIVNDARLMFWLANYDAVNDQFYFDDVILTKVSTQSVQPTIITHPSSQTISVGKTATFSVTASGTAPLSYQWKKNGINIQGATLASYTTPSVSISDNGYSFSVVVTNSIGSVTSNPAKLTVVPVASNQLSNPGFESGTSPWAFFTDGSGSFLNDAAGYGSPHAGHIKISQQGTNVQLYQNNLVLEPNTLYKLDFKAYSNTGHDLSVSLFKHNSPYTNYGLSKSLDIGTTWGTYSIQFTTVGFPAIVNDARLMFWLANYDAANDQFYFDDVLLTKVSAQPQPVKPTIITHPASQTIVVGKTATFSVTASGTAPLSYQWKKNGINIPGATLASYTTPSASISDNGASFSVVVTNSIGSVTSNPAKLTVSSVSSKQLVLLDVTYTHNNVSKAFSFFNLPSGVPSNLVTPVNYANGRIYQRVQVITKPSTNSVFYQMCLFQDKIVAEKHACTGGPVFTGTGTYYSNQLMTSLFQYNVISWSRSLLIGMLVVKDKNGTPVDDRYGWAGKWIGSPKFNLYYPMKVRYTAIIVPPGGGEPVWP